MEEQFNNNDEKLRSKDTRWDRIRKRHTNAINVKTETVKKLFAIDFVGRKQLKTLNGDLLNDPVLDPVLVMDLRHEIIKRQPRKKRESIAEKEALLEKLKTHNQSVEETYIENQIKNFKTELVKSRPKQQNLKPKLCLNLNNHHIFKSIEVCNNHLVDFYNTSNEVLTKENELYEIKLTQNNNQKLSNNQKYIQKPVTPCDKSVRFEESVEVINYSREESFCSNTSEGVDSVISDVVEEVLNEIEAEEKQLEMVGKHFDKFEKQKSEMKNDLIQERINIVCVQEKKKNQIVQTKIEDDNGAAPLKITKIQHQETEVKLVFEIHTDEEDEHSSSNSSSQSNQQNAIIEELFRPRMYNTEVLLRKYLLKWIHFTTIEKIEKHNFMSKCDRIHKINAFLDNIRREKNRISKDKVDIKNGTKENSVILAKKYQNKIKVQQDIIELQKLKLERQERMIMELKLSKLSEEARKAKEEVKQELKSVIKTGEVKNRTKAKSLQLVANLRDEEDEEFARLQGKALLMPKFLAKMQERAQERYLKHEQARERRLRLEVEKEAAKHAAEEAKRLEDEEAKRLRIEALKEKRRQEKLAKVMKEKERQRCIENNKKAQEFCRRRLLRSVGMESFKRLIKMKRKNQRIAELHRRNVLKKKITKIWKEHTEDAWDHKKKKADELYKQIVKRRAMKAWIEYINMQKSKYLVAVDWYELKISEYVFQQWLGQMKLEKLIEETKAKQAQSHYNWHMKWKVLDHWQRLPQVLKLEKETEERRQRWRLKIWELLPDYTPNRDEQK